MNKVSEKYIYNKFRFLQGDLDAQTGLLTLTLNRPKKLNALSFQLIDEIGQSVNQAHVDPRVRAILLKAKGKHFCSGLDLLQAPEILKEILGKYQADPARNAMLFHMFMEHQQNCFHTLQTCRVPVIAAVHGYCLGGAIDLISAADIVLCSKDSTFGIQEINIGMAADWGTLQRMTKKAKNHMLFRELCYTGKRFKGQVAMELGLVHSVGGYSSEQVQYQAKKLALSIAEKSPVATMMIKMSLNYALDHSMKDGLEQIKTANAAALQCPDNIKAAMTKLRGQKMIFPKL